MRLRVEREVKGWEMIIMGAGIFLENKMYGENTRERKRVDNQGLGRFRERSRDLAE